MLRVASLLPATTEIVCALGLEPALVGRSHECDFPPSVAGLPALTAPRLDTNRSSRAIDDSVRALLRQALSIYDVDAERLRALHPDLILTQTRCEVCAVTPADVEKALAEWNGSAGERPRVVSLAPGKLEDVFRDVQQVARALEATERGVELVGRLRERALAIAGDAAALPPGPAVACVEWIEPLMGAGYWIPEMVGMAGGRNLVGRAGAQSPWLTWPSLRAMEPDALILMPCGFSLERTREEMAAQRRRPAWAETWGALGATRAGQVYLVDGNQYFNRPGPRLVDSLEILAEILHPGRFAFGHEGTGWLRWDGR